jgi:hypothetical protein
VSRRALMSRIGGWPNKWYSPLNGLRFHIQLQKGRTRGIEPVDAHAVPGGMQPKLLLIPRLAHRCQGAEVVMERRSSHACHLCEFLYMQGLVEVGSEPGDRLRRSVALVPRRSDRTQTFPLRTSKQAVDDLTLDRVAEER